MSYATLMVYVDVEGKMDGRVSVAADLARRFDDATAANSLLRFIADENISLVAAGGYGRSRLGEWAYGWGHPRPVGGKSGLLPVLALMAAEDRKMISPCDNRTASKRTTSRVD